MRAYHSRGSSPRPHSSKVRLCWGVLEELNLLICSLHYLISNGFHGFKWLAQLVRNLLENYILHIDM